MQSRCIRELADEQWEDGGWGRLVHSRNTKLKQKIASTEVGVERALALGLDATHPISRTRYLLAILQGKLAFPDYHEKNDRWQTGMRLLLTSTLSFIPAGHPSWTKTGGCGSKSPGGHSSRAGTAHRMRSRLTPR